MEISIGPGVCEFPAPFTDHSQWIEAAHKALCHARETGRNRSCVFIDEADCECSTD